MRKKWLVEFASLESNYIQQVTYDAETAQEARKQADEDMARWGHEWYIRHVLEL